MKLPWRRTPWFVRTDSNTIEVQIPNYPRTAAEVAVRDLRQLLVDTEEDDSSRALLARLYPTAYPDHPGLDREYQRYMRSELLASRLSSLDTLDATLGEDQLTDDQANAWLQGINAARVLCGTILGVDHDGWTPDELDLDDPDDMTLQVLALYDILGEILFELLSVLMGDGPLEPHPDDPRIDPDALP